MSNLESTQPKWKTSREILKSYSEVVPPCRSAGDHADLEQGKGAAVETLQYPLTRVPLKELWICMETLLEAPNCPDYGKVKDD